MKLLLTGDSIIARHEGLNEPRLDYNLKKSLPNCKIINTAVNGINSGGFYASLPELVFKQQKCDYLILLIGTNDLAIHKQVPLSQFEANIKLIASSINWLYYPKKVIFISPPAVDEKKQHVRNNLLVKQYSHVMQKIAQQYRFSYIDLASKMIEQGNLDKLCCGSKNDGLHFGVTGYELLSNLILQKISNL